MRRSEINRILREAVEFLNERRFPLPPFAFWSPEDWKGKGHEFDEIRDNMLGWDITDFGSGDFYRIGLVLFTIRNGNVNNPKYKKPYAEKILIVRENQVTPMHFHFSKMEDIINRGGGNLLIKLFNSTDDEDFAQTPVRVSVDGELRVVDPGSIIRLRPGESITLPPRLYHEFWGEEGTGMVLVGEVSTINDDRIDNRFNPPVGRFPEIEEDEPPLYLLCTEYPPAP
jgi:D-lyxose ketol-isomerase